MFMLCTRSHSRFRVTITSETDLMNERPTVKRSRLNPVPAQTKITVAPKPVSINPATFTRLDQFNPLSGDRKGRYRQEKAEARKSGHIPNF
ncbi:MAG TPA: hypothetical protein VER35_02560 [Candidatus Limnocylindrales bacterium]|nr:hypothetical protein [Candidatus Limnocylindrales bacterium]